MTDVATHPAASGALVTESPDAIDLSVTGMTCGGCVKRVAAALEAVPGVPIITGHARDPEHLAVQLEENMVFIFKPSAETPGGTHICTWGDTVLITPGGGRRMGKRPHELAVAGG